MSSSFEELISHDAEVHMCVYGPVSKIPFLRKLMKSGMQPLRPHGPFSIISNFCFMKMSTNTFRPGESQCVPFIHASLPQSTPRDKRDDERNLEIPFSSPTPDIPFISLKLATIVFNCLPGGSGAQSSLSSTTASQAACEPGKDESVKTMED